MRIAWTGPVGNLGGVQSMGLLMLRELLRQGVEVDLYFTADRNGPVPIEPMPGLRIITVQTGWQWRRWYSNSKAKALFSGLAARAVGGVVLSVRLLLEHRRRRYDAVYQLSQTELFVLGWLRRFAPPIIVHPCTHTAGELRWHRAEQRYALKSEPRSSHLLMRAWLTVRSRLQPKELARADLVLGLSARFNELVHEDYGVPQEKLRVLRSPVDLERFSPGGSPHTVGPRTLLFISRMSARKGVAEIVELSHRLDDLSGSVRLIAIGGATQWSDYRAHLADLNPRVAEYIGGLETAVIPEIMRSATMLLVPSRYEPGSITTAEALACGLPVVLSDEVGNAEFAHGPHVRIHRAGDVDSLEEAVRSLLRSIEDDETALRASARANAESQFAPSLVIAQLRRLIERSPTQSTASVVARIADRVEAPVDGDDALARR